jgi:hypothetical protein
MKSLPRCNIPAYFIILASLSQFEQPAKVSVLRSQCHLFPLLRLLELPIATLRCEDCVAIKLT